MCTRSKSLCRGLGIWLAAGVWLGTSALVAQSPPAVGSPGDLTVSVLTDDSVYPPGVPIAVSAHVCNETSELIRFYGARSCDPYLEVLNEALAVVAFARCDGTTGDFPRREFSPGACETQAFEWLQTSGRFAYEDSPPGPQVEQGLYSIRFRYRIHSEPRIEGLSAPIRIAAPAIVPAIGPWGVGLLALSIGTSASLFLRKR